MNICEYMMMSRCLRFDVLVVVVNEHALLVDGEIDERLRKRALGIGAGKVDGFGPVGGERLENPASEMQVGPDDALDLGTESVIC